MSILTQKTISKKISTEGIGIHTGLKFEKSLKEEILEKLKKNQKKIGFFHRFFNFFGNG